MRDPPTFAVTVCSQSTQISMLQATWASAEYSLQLVLPPAEALRRCWTDTDSLFARVNDWTQQPIELRHPFSFYYVSAARSGIFIDRQACIDAKHALQGMNGLHGIHARIFHAHPAVAPTPLSQCTCGW